jgi:hypothetical protein
VYDRWGGCWAEAGGEERGVDGLREEGFQRVRGGQGEFLEEVVVGQWRGGGGEREERELPELRGLGFSEGREVGCAWDSVSVVRSGDL